MKKKGKDKLHKREDERMKERIRWEKGRRKKELDE